MPVVSSQRHLFAKPLLYTQLGMVSAQICERAQRPWIPGTGREQDDWSWYQHHYWGRASTRYVWSIPAI